jgi:hypothetical protein
MGTVRARRRVALCFLEACAPGKDQRLIEIARQAGEHAYLAYLSQNSVSKDLELVGMCIAELRKVLKTAATKIPGLLTLKLKRAA